MNKKSTLKTPDPSGHNISNATDIDKDRSAVEPHHEAETNDVESCDGTKSCKSYGSETSEHNIVPVSSTEELTDMHDIQNVITDSETDEERDIHETSADSYSDDEGKEIHNLCENDEKKCRYLNLAAKYGDTEFVRSLLLASANINAPDREHNTPLYNATRYGHIDVVDLLLRKNASVNSRNALGQTSLHLASKHGHFEIAQLLLKNNADVNATEQSNNTPIDIATKHGHCELVQLLISSNDLLSQEETFLLHSAAKCGNAKDVHQLLLNSNVNPDTTNLYGDTPLHLAAENGHFEVVEVLLRNNADANIRNASFKTPLHIAAEIGYAEIVKALVDHEADVNAIDRYGDTTLHLAASNSQSAGVNVLLNQAKDNDAQTHSQLAVSQVATDKLDPSQHHFKSKAGVGQTSFPNPITAEDGTIKITDTLLSHSSKPKIAFKKQLSTLCLSVTQGYCNFQKILTFNSANVNADSNDKMTPLHLACQNGHASIVEILLDNHVTVDATTQYKKTLFSLAAENGHAEVTDLLLHRGVCDFVLTDRKETPLYIAVKNGHTKVVEVILKHSCGMSEKFTKGGGKLQENTKKNFMPVEILKSDDRRISAEIVWTERYTPLELKRDSFGISALVLAAKMNYPKMVQILLSVDEYLYSETDVADSFRSITAGILPNYSAHEVSSEAKKYRINMRKTVQFLINSSKFNVNHQDEKLNSFLHDVMKHVYELSADSRLTEESQRLRVQIQIEVIQLLLDKGADFNMKNSDGETPLMMASAKGCCEIIQILFDWEEKSELKVDIDARDHYGATALIKAAQYRHVSVMRLLLEHKASVNLCDYYGCTALHAVFYDPNKKWFDGHILGERLCRRKFDNEEDPQIDHKDSFYWELETVDRNEAIYQLWETLEHDDKTTGIREEMVKLLLDYVETDVNARDFRGNTPLDLAMMSSKPITSAIFHALKNCGAILNLLGLKEEPTISETMVDERGRNPLHLLIISHVLYEAKEHRPEKGHILVDKRDKKFEKMVYGILKRHKTFRELAAATDDKGRTPLHYALMPSMSIFFNDTFLKLVKALLQLGSNLNAVDMYGKTLLHYETYDEQYKLLVRLGASENIKDKKGYTPKELKQLRESVTKNEDNGSNLPIGQNALSISADVAKVLNSNHVTELSKQKLAEEIRIFSQSPRPEESSQKTIIWDIWAQNDFIRLNRRLGQLNTITLRFIKHLADGIKTRDERFECEPRLVGSAEEETKVVISGDYDFNFKLIKFSQLCEPFPHPLGPKGYFELRRKPIMDIEGLSDGRFDCFFNSDQCLLTDEVNSRFQIFFEEVLRDNNFWQDEQMFESHLPETGYSIIDEEAVLCQTVRLRMLHPIDDEDGGFLLINISIDIVACVQVVDWWPEDPLPVGTSQSVKTQGCTFVFDRPRFDPSKPSGTDFPFSDTFARISFAPVESQIIRESSLLMKAAYMVCKLMVLRKTICTYQLKTCLLFCIESLNTQSGSETRNEIEITPKQLAFWVERIMFCLVEFSRHDIYPCYFMPLFMQQGSFAKNTNTISREINQKEVRAVSISFDSFYDFYLDICPDNIAFKIPIHNDEDYTGMSRQRLNACCYPSLEQFDREEFIRKLSSRSLV